ncbi:MAG: hypothetical protein RLN59_01990, partial [Haliea sp.]
MSLPRSWLIHCCFTAALLGQALTASLALAGQTAVRYTAITGVSVIPMDAPRVLNDQTVLIADDRIVALGDAGTVTVPSDARRIEGTGRYLMPGLADMHAHIYGISDEGQEASSTAMAREQLLVYAATGVTLLRDAAGSPG